MSRYRQRKAKELAERYLRARSVKPLTDPSDIRAEFEKLQESLVFLVSLKNQSYPGVEDFLRSHIDDLSKAKEQIEGLVPGDKGSKVFRWISSVQFGSPLTDIVDKASYVGMKVGVILESAQALASGRASNLGPDEWEWYLSSTSSAAEDLASMIRKVVSNNPLPKSESFTYRKLQILNPEGLPPVQVKMALGGIDYILDLFEKKGLSKALLKTLGRVLLLTEDPDCPGTSCGRSFAGLYVPKVREIRMYGNHLHRGFGTLFERWADEIFLHEFGHMVHL
ncbi:MAG: hypothetical protein ACYTFG_02195, partial [Planctomycetota bacterium]